MSDSMLFLTSDYSHPTTKEAFVYGRLREAILNCDLQPEEKLVMDRLSEELGISPIPIRGALRRLEAEGLVTIEAHTGAAVAPVLPGSIVELFTLAAALESIVLRFLAPKINSYDLDGLRAIVKAMDQATTDNEWQTWLRLDFEFHTGLAHLSSMVLLADFITRTHESWLRLSQCVFVEPGPLRMVEAHDEHWQMISLLEQGDSPALETLIVRHYRLSLQAYQVTYRDIIAGGPAAG